MTEQKELQKLLLRQARRREIPHNIMKGVLGFFFVLVLFSAMVECGTRMAGPPQRAHQDASKNLFKDDAEAHKRRIP